jgi:hypothetical protein
MNNETEEYKKELNRVNKKRKSLLAQTNDSEKALTKLYKSHEREVAASRKRYNSEKKRLTKQLKAEERARQAELASLETRAAILQGRIAA